MLNILLNLDLNSIKLPVFGHAWSFWFCFSEILQTCWTLLWSELCLSCAVACHSSRFQFCCLWDFTDIYTCLNFSMTRIESLSCFGDASFHSPQKLENACRNGCGERLFMMQIYAMGATTSVEILQKVRDGMLYFIMPRIPAQYVCQQCHFQLACCHQLWSAYYTSSWFPHQKPGLKMSLVLGVCFQERRWQKDKRGAWETQRRENKDNTGR